MKEIRDEDIEIALEGEAGDPEQSEGQFDVKAKKLREEISRLRGEKQEYMDGWQRAKADYVNALKRFEEEKKLERARGIAKAAEILLPAFDSLERSREHGRIPEGFVAIAKQLENAFAALGLEPVGQVGEPFDPALHEALGQDVAESSGEDDTVSVVLESGWKIGEVLIRPAKVRVAHFEKTN